MTKKIKSSPEKLDDFVDKWSIVHSRLGDELGIITNQTLIPDKDDSPRYTVLLTHFRYYREPWKPYLIPYFCSFTISEMTLLEEAPSNIEVTKIIKELLEDQKRILITYKEKNL